MLTREQRLMRRTGIGASEVGAVAGLNPYRGPIDVWLRKPTASRPLDVDEPEVEVDDAEPGALRRLVGAELEEGMRRVYSSMTGNVVRRVGETFRHSDPAFPFVLASPDGLPDDPDPQAPGLEIKIVGARVVHQWDEDSVPDDVRAQCAQNMMVLGRERWDVIALLGGTEPRVYRLTRDRDLEAALIEAQAYFWTTYVVGDVCPPPIDEQERRRYLRERYPGSTAKTCRTVDTEEARGLVVGLADAKAAKVEAEERERAITNDLCALVGDDYGIEGAWGRFLWIPKRGSTSWKAVAETLAGGVVPETLIEANRGAAFRSPMMYPRKTTDTNRRMR